MLLIKRLIGYHTVVALLLLSLTFAVAAAERRTLVISIPDSTASTSTGAWVKLIYEDAFARLGFGFKLLVVPAKRASYMADKGEVDGEALRIKDYELEHPDQIRLTTPVVYDDFNAYATRSLVLDDNWDSLKDTKLRVDYVRGIALAALSLSSRVPEDLLGNVDSTRAGFLKLLANRSDIFVVWSSSANSELRDPQFTNSTIHKVATMGRVHGYTYLHRQNKDLVIPLDKVLAEMLKDGTIANYRKQALQ